tara:strand:- start:1870 stop:2355 length:486 start_codon:yes stop_codon:yes gene_type:complete
MTLAHNTGQPVIPIIIDSYGGQVYSLMHMIAAIESSSIPVMTIAQGKAMSCGAVLLSFGAAGMRYAAPTATIMIHDVASGAMGKVEDLKSKTKEASRLNKQIFSMMDRNCGKPDGFFLGKLQEKSRADWYLTGKKAKKHGLVNHLRIPTMKVDIDVSISIK